MSEELAPDPRYLPGQPHPSQPIQCERPAEENKEVSPLDQPQPDDI